jgi:hypothetical protein
MVFYKDKSIPGEVAADVTQALADVTSAVLDAKMEVRVVEPVQSFNANEIHIEMRFRDFMEWDDDALQQYHDKIMAAIGDVLKSHGVSCRYSFYIVPSLPPRSIWAQSKS